MTLAGRILPNGTFIGMVKVHGKTGSEAHLVVANDWSNPNGYVRNGGASFTVKSLLEGCTVTPLRRYAIRWRNGYVHGGVVTSIETGVLLVEFMLTCAAWT